MRFMMMVKATPETEAGRVPNAEALAAMGRFNEEMLRAGVLLDGGGLRPSASGVRVRHQGGRKVTEDGPFQPSGTLLAGYWIIQVRSREEALEWARRVPHGPHDGEIELRPFVEPEEPTGVPMTKAAPGRPR